MGLSECGNYTAGIKAIAALFPAATRASAGGFFNAGAQFGSIVATPLVVFIATHLGWRLAFLIPGAWSASLADALAGLLPEGRQREPPTALRDRFSRGQASALAS